MNATALDNKLFYIETSIPAGQTVSAYRRSRPPKASRWQRLKQLAGGAQAATA